jgi:hypothetical protein
MIGCSRWMDAIAGCALGETPGPGLAAHLAICPRCANALQDSRALAARIDEVLHRSAAVEPPRYGPERVMARVHGQADPRAWRWGPQWGWQWMAVGSAVLAVSIAIALWRRPAPAADATALATWHSPTQALLRPPVAAAWNTRPLLGEGFFKIKQSEEIHAQ